MEAGWKLGGRKKKTVRRVIEGTVLSLFLAKAKKKTCEFFIFYFYRGPQKATLCDPTRIQPQIQFRLADYAITIVNLQKKNLFISLK
jgi:hypothetical protein